MEEAVQLVIQAAAVGRDGEALIVDMGCPVRIRDVAQHLIDRSDRHIGIEYTGLRPGEKLHERLLAEGEDDLRPVHPLLSHVPVPPLPWDVVLGHAGACAATMRGLLEHWCRQTPVTLPVDDSVVALAATRSRRGLG